MSANTPTDIRFSFTGLMQRGGATGPHRDGWGVAFYEGRGVRVFHEPAASANSEIAGVVQRLPIKSEVVISHIRQANVGSVCLVNTHPFIRELWGRYWTFAHNGQIPGFRGRSDTYQPVGSTDSESLFCDLLNQLRTRHHPDTAEADLMATVVAQCAGYARGGVCNILLSNGEWLFTFCSSKLFCITRRAPFGPARLKDADVVVDFQQETTANDVVSVIATEPLTTDETWTPYQRGEWRLWRAGETVACGKVALPPNDDAASTDLSSNTHSGAL
jgi:predicted glutamine amidotransferase